jgi:hypothetical protein
VEQNYEWARRNHQIEFGWRFRQEYLDTIPDRPDQSDLDFNSFATALYNPATGTAFGAAPQTGDNGANFFLGMAGRHTQARPPGPYNMHGKDESAYIQDNWKVRRNLTINLGLRWEYLGPYLDSNGVTSGWRRFVVGGGRSSRAGAIDGSFGPQSVSVDDCRCRVRQVLPSGCWKPRVRFS